jgi:3D-(3,5/4)-trihydroxycyclohexane-1,2-dione acylhydrolase (decyclizing)
METVRLTAAQALIRFLAAQYVERDGVRSRFFAGCFGIFGHGNVGVAQALLQHSDLMPYHQARNEQAMVHIAAGYARMSDLPAVEKVRAEYETARGVERRFLG